MRPDVAQRRSPQQRIANSVREHVRIRVTQQTLFERNIYAAKHKLPPFNQPVYVISDADSSRFVHY
jgi:hypothetical protein